MAYVKYMELIAPLDAVEQILGWIFVRWSNSDKIDDNFRGTKLGHGVVKVGDL